MMPCLRAMRLTSRRLAIEKGWPPMRLVVHSMRMKGIASAPFSAMAASSRSVSMLPLKGCVLAVFSASDV